MAKARVTGIAAANLVEGTLVYVTDDVVAGDSATFTGTGKGFYSYDAAASRWVKIGSGAATASNNIYTADGTLAANRTVNMDGKSLTYYNISGGIGINKVASDGFGLDINTESRTSGNIYFQPGGSGIDAGDIIFKNGPTASVPNKIIGRIWSNPSGSGILMSGHDNSVAPFISDLSLSQGDLVIEPTGEIRFNTVKENAAAGKILVHGADGIIGYRNASSLAGPAEGSFTRNIRVDTGSTVTILPTDYFVHMTSSSAGTITLPDASSSTGRVLCFFAENAVMNTGALGNGGNVNPGYGACIISNGTIWITQSSL